jgi:hypothetical protein
MRRFDFQAFKDNFREMKAFHYECEAFIKIKRLFKDKNVGFNKQSEAF